MEFKMWLLATFAANVAGLPHVGMLETPTVHDVGLFFDDRNYHGRSTFLVETKDTPTCIPINVDATGHAQGLQIMSVQVCKPTKCAFFTEDKCVANSTGVFSVSCTGPGDMPNHESNKVFKSYICGMDLTKVADMERSVPLSMMPHDPNAGMV